MITSKETVRFRRVTVGILPCVKITKLNRDANLAKSAYASTVKLTVSPTKKPKKSGGKGSVASLRNSKQVGCAFQDIDPPKYKSMFSEERNILGTEAQRALLKRCLTPRKNKGKKGSIAGCQSAS